MTTQHTLKIAALFPTQQGHDIHDVMVQTTPPTGERFFRVRPTHLDSDGREWTYTNAPARPGRAQVFGKLRAHYPEAEMHTTAEVVALDEVDGRRTLWVDKKNGVAMVEIVSKEEIVGHLHALPIDVNTAPQSTLTALPKIGPSTAESIIGGRPYDTVDDLTRVSGIGESTLDGIRDYVTAGER